uniref:Tyrosine-protein kinase n=1 Tax=Caenorhabditis tropicalis TaxID=1561998 RepID=A0A1I7V535_9PELO
MPKKDQNSCQTAEAIVGKRESNTNIQVEGLIVTEGGGTAEGAGNTTDLEHSGSFPDLKQSGVTSDDEYIKTSLLQHAWYHGVMFGKVTEKLLKWENAYLVRRSVVKSNRFLCVSANVEGKVTHFPLNVNLEGWSCPKLFEKFPQLNGKRFPHIFQLLDAWSLCTNYIVPVSRKSMVLSHSSITLENALGRGSFGEVFKAFYQAKEATEPIVVAAKRLIGDAKRPQLQDFCNEASVMAVLDHHSHIVSLYGFASLQMPLMLIMELVPGGDLKKYLKTTPSIPNKQILLFALDIASGMCHLASKKVIHRDLAARNCLITEELRVKISDFGLSVNETEITVKNLRKAPIRWLAPETLFKGIFNEKTDVWAYGVLLTELMTRCANDPLYPKDLKGVQRWIKESDHPHKIEHGEPMELAEVVDACCEKSISSRLDFRLARKKVAKIHQKMADQELANALSPNPLSPRPNYTLEKKKSEDWKSNADRKTSIAADRRASNITLTRKKSRDGPKKKDKTKERKQKGMSGGTAADKKKLVSNRREKKANVPVGMSPNPQPK